MNKQYHAVIFTMCATYNMKTFGAHKVAHELRMHGYDVLVVNYMDEFSIDELQAIVRATVSDQTLFVGTSNTFIGFGKNLNVRGIKVDSKPVPHDMLLPGGREDEKKFVDLIKTINPNCKIVSGGARTSMICANPLIDYAVVGYADQSIVDLADHLSKGTPLTKRNHKSLAGVTVINDDLAPDFDFNNSTMTWQKDDDIIIPGEILPLELSRGCIFACKFCNFRLNGKKAFDYVKDPEIIYRELVDNYNNFRITKYRVLDDTFNDIQDKLDIMTDIVKRLPFKPLFGGYARVDLMTAHPHTIAQMVDMGFRSMYFGIETLNRKTGSAIGKGGDPDKIVETIQQIKKTYGDYVALTGSFIVGLPYETKQSVQNSMRRLISGEIPLDFVTYYPLTIMRRGGSMWESAFDLDLQKYGYREDQDSEFLKSGAVQWKNDYMSYFEAISLSSEFQREFMRKRDPVGKNATDQLLYNGSDFVDTKYKKQLFQLLDIKL